MRTSLYAVLTAVLAVPAAAIAQPAPPPAAGPAPPSPRSPAFDSCLQRAQTTLAMNECLSAEIAVQDRRLNQVYQQAMARTPPQAQDALREAQRAWIAFRDADCAAYANPAFGSQASVSGGFCRLEATVGRADQLADFPPQPDAPGR